MRMGFMNDKILHLDVTTNTNFLNISLSYANANIIGYKKQLVLLNKIESRCHEFIHTLNFAKRTNDQTKSLMDTVKQFGQSLCNDLIPIEIKSKLMNEDADYLILSIDNHLVNIPWELIIINNHFLCEIFSMGRKIKTPQTFIERDRKQIRLPLQMLIIANPRGDLKTATQEAIDICSDLDQEKIIQISMNSELSAEALCENFQSYDIIHFAGHASYHPQSPHKSGWQLAGEDMLTAAKIHQMTGNSFMPFMVFSNACQSARTEKWTQNNYDEYGIANAFMASGVSAYIGTHWDIHDESGRIFAQEFYQNIVLGCSVGKAIKNTRLKLLKSMPEIDWAAYVLYGDPCVTFVSDNSYRPIEFSHQLNMQTESSLKKQLISLNLNSIKEIRHWFTAFLFMIICSIGIIIIHNYYTQDAVIKVKKILITMTDQKQQRIESLFKELADIAVPVTSSQTDKINIEMLVESKHENPKMEDMILAVIQNKFVRHTNYRILESSGQSLDKVLEALLYKTKLFEKQEPIQFFMPDIIIFIALHNCGSKSIVLLRPVHVKHQSLLDKNIFVELNNDASIRSQREKLTKELAEILK